MLAETVHSDLKQTNESSFHAVRQYLEAEKSYDKIKNRLKIMELKQKRDMNKIQLQKKLIDKMQNMKQNNAAENRKRDELLKDNGEDLQKQKQKNQSVRQKHKEMMNAFRESSNNEKKEAHNSLNKLSRTIQQNIKAERQSQIDLNRKKKEEVKFKLKKSKQNQMKFYKNKQKQINQMTKKQVQYYQEQKRMKEKDLERANEKETEMLNKHQSSQTQYRKLKRELSKVLKMKPFQLDQKGPIVVPDAKQKASPKVKKNKI